MSREQRGGPEQMEVSEVRRRLRAAVEQARAAAEQRRARKDQAARDYDALLEQRIIPVFHHVAAALTSEGHLFKVFTPAGSARLASERSHEDYIELALDDASDPPAVVGRTSRGRGRRMISSERPVAPGVPIAGITEEHVLAFVLEEVVGFIGR